jgi:hypothetical protein
MNWIARGVGEKHTGSVDDKVEGCECYISVWVMLDLESNTRI